MVDDNIDTPNVTEATPETTPSFEKVAPIDSRFLFVDVAALRAKQLRRGARPRLNAAENQDNQQPQPRKPERVAMEEVRQGLVPYDLPEAKAEPLGDAQ